MRLIDADALKGKLPEPNTTKQIWVYQTLCDFIDNAPTVAECCKELHEVATERPQGDCENCDFRKFTEDFISGVVKTMNKNGIASVEQLSEILKSGQEVKNETDN